MSKLRDAICGVPGGVLLQAHSIRLLIGELKHSADRLPIQDVVATILRDFGWCAETASNGDQALMLFGTGEFDLVITDLNMPGMRGDQLALEIRKKMPDLPVALLTGTIPHNCPQGFTIVLPKPFSARCLEEVVSNLA